MTQSERVHDYFKTNFSATSVVASAASAGLSPLNNQPEEWGQGSTGYSGRYLNAYASGVLRHTRTLLARRDDGSRRVSISRLGGTAGTAFVSRICRPADTNSVGDAWSASPSPWDTRQPSMWCTNSSPEGM